MMNNRPMSDSDNKSERTPDSAAEARKSAWSDYWASGALHSCTGSFEHNYAGPIADFWRSQVQQVVAPARLLEVCCGNAPLSKWIADNTDLLQRGLEIEATDLAEVAPAWPRQLPPSLQGQVRIRAGIDACQLPFPDAHFSLVLSQYGIEYVGRPGLVELLRVTRPGGRVAAVLHHQESLPLRFGRAELETLAWVRGPEGPLQRAADLIEPMARSATADGLASLRADSAAALSRTRFNDALRDLQSRQRDALAAPLLDEVAQRLLALLDVARQQGRPAAEDAWRQEQQRLAQVELRQRELVECAFSEAELLEWLDLPGARLQSLQTLDLGDQGLAGWAAVLIKN